MPQICAQIAFLAISHTQPQGSIETQGSRKFGASAYICHCYGAREACQSSRRLA